MLYYIDDHIISLIHISYRTPYIVEMITEGPDKGRGEGGRVMLHYIILYVVHHIIL